MNAPIAQPRATSIAQLYAHQFAFVWRMLRRFGVDREDLEDRAHDVFLVAHRRWEDFEGRSSDTTWLYGIARRVAADHRRARERRNRRRQALTEVERVAAPTRQDASEALIFLDAFLGSLDEDLREAFVLFELEGLRGQEASEMTGVNTNTLYARRRRAKQAFETMLGSDEVGSKQLRRVGRGHEPDRQAEQRVASLLPFVVVGAPGAAESFELLEAAGSSAPATGGLKIAAVVAGLVAVMGVVSASLEPDPAPSDATQAKVAPQSGPATPKNAQDDPAGPAQVDPPSPPIAEPSAAAPPEPRPDLPAHDSVAPASPPVPASSPDPQLAPSSDLAAQTAKHEKARAALRDGKADLALQLASDYLARYPGGPFADSSRLLRIESLCATGSTDAARKEAESLARSSRDPTIQAAARKVCP